MALADRTFSFRAPAQLAQRLGSAEQAYAELARDPAKAARISRELEIQLQRWLRREPGRAALLGRVPRALTEAFVTAVERATQEERLIEDLRAFDRSDTTGDAERRALLRASSLGQDE
ncbi:hypothetical protein BH20ACT19_BH20ACT19_05060 [soil metagenome]